MADALDTTVLYWTRLFVIAVFGVFGKRVNDGRKQFCSFSQSEHGYPFFLSQSQEKCIRKVLVVLENILGTVFPLDFQLKHIQKPTKTVAFELSFWQNEYHHVNFSHIWSSHTQQTESLRFVLLSVSWTWSPIVSVWLLDFQSMKLIMTVTQFEAILSIVFNCFS